MSILHSHSNIVMLQIFGLQSDFLFEERMRNFYLEVNLRAEEAERIDKEEQKKTLIVMNRKERERRKCKRKCLSCKA